MRTVVTRIAILVVVAVVVLAVAVVAFAGAPSVIVTHSGAVPDVQCPSGVSPAQATCFATAPPHMSKGPDTNVPPPTQSP